jgi:hypothetical protein
MYLTACQQHTIPVGIRGWFDPLFRELFLTTYISVVSLGPPNVVDTGSPCIEAIHKYRKSTERERRCESTGWIWFTLQKPRVFILEREWTTRAPTSISNRQEAPVHPTLGMPGTSAQLRARPTTWLRVITSASLNWLYEVWVEIIKKRKNVNVNIFLMWNRFNVLECK